LAEQGAQQGVELTDALGGTRHGLVDGVELHTKEGQSLGWTLGFVWIDDETELADDGLSQGEMTGHLCVGGSDEEEVVEVYDGADAELGEGEMDDGQQLSTDARGCAETEGHVSELVELTFEAKAEVLAHGR
jgi:hypothetical protein